MKKQLLITIILLSILSLSVSAVNYGVEILSVTSASGGLVQEDSTTYINVKVTNLETTFVTDYARIEAGIYTKSDVNSWYVNPVFAFGSNIINANNCKENEPNVDSILVSLAPQQSTIVTFVVTTPEIDNDQEDLFGVHIQSFLNCWTPTTPTGQMAYDVEPIHIENFLIGSNPDPINHCANAYTDYDESDIDCGGDECNDCQTGYRCKSDSDCSNGQTCTNVNSFDSNFRCGTDTLPPITPPTVDLGGKIPFPESKTSYLGIIVVVGLVAMGIILVRRWL